MTTVGFYSTFYGRILDLTFRPKEYKARLRQPSQEHVRMDNSEKLKKLFDSVTKVSAKEDLYWHIKMAMLIAIAKREG